MKKCYIKDMKIGKKIESSFMIKKILYRDGNNITVIIQDKTGEIKGSFKDKNNIFKVGDVITLKGTFNDPLKIDNEVKKEIRFDILDYIPSVDKPIEEILHEIEKISEEEFKDSQIKALDEYFFRNENFLKKFKMAIGGIYQHHNYLGGLAEHTLNVMYLAKTLAYRYDCRYKEIAILAAKLHDIGKVEEMFYNGPFQYTLKGEMEGHIVIGISMIEEAFNDNKNAYSEEFKERIKGCIVQHHGKLEYGSPKEMKTEEAYIVHYSDYIDANFNKIKIISKNVSKGEWSPYEKRIEGRLFL